MMSRHPPQQYYRRPHHQHTSGHRVRGPGGPPHHSHHHGPPSHIMRDRWQRQEAPRSDKPFHLDKYSADPKTPMEIPMYRVVNEVPLPFRRDAKGLIPSLLRCFNCGADDHKVSDCKLELSRQFINMNKSWMNEYARIGVKRQKENFSSRYFVQPSKRPKLPGTTDTETSSSGAVERKPLKETTPPPTLQIWNDPQDVPKPKPAREQHNRGHRGGRPDDYNRNRHPAPRGGPRHMGYHQQREYNRSPRQQRYGVHRGHGRDRGGMNMRYHHNGPYGQHQPRGYYRG